MVPVSGSGSVLGFANLIMVITLFTYGVFVLVFLRMAAHFGLLPMWGSN